VNRLCFYYFVVTHIVMLKVLYYIFFSFFCFVLFLCFVEKLSSLMLPIKRTAKRNNAKTKRKKKKKELNAKG
jgi:hypothetical protein